MGFERSSAYYDANTRLHMLPLEKSPWRALYEGAWTLLVGFKGRPLADLGCGTGRFAKLLQGQGWSNYWGVDFSEVRIKEARRYVPGFEFTCEDLLSVHTVSRFCDFEVFVLLEVLEHIREDLQLLQSLPPGAAVIFSVPNFDDPAHVRWFSSKAHIVNRYQTILDFSDASWLQLQDASSGKSIFLCRCRRKHG